MENIRREVVRRLNAVSLAELRRTAAEIGVSEHTLIAIRGGQRPNPTFTTFSALVRYYKIRLADYENGADAS